MTPLMRLEKEKDPPPYLRGRKQRFSLLIRVKSEAWLNPNPYPYNKPLPVPLSLPLPQDQPQPQTLALNIC